MCNKQISIDDALKKAFWSIKLPSMAMLLVPLLSYVVLAKLEFLPSIGYEGLKWAGPTFLIGIIGSWLVWSIQVPRWKLWAYQRVENIEALKEAAISKQYIWPEGSMFQKTEIASKQVWAEIERIETSSDKNT